MQKVTNLIHRDIFPQLLAHLSEQEVTVITGMRRTGKTTSVHYLLEQIPHNNKIYIDLERLEDRAIFKQPNFSDIESGLRFKGIDFTKDSAIALDEVQLVPEIVSFIKYYHDHYPVKFIISGSSSYYLKNRFTESLAGRKHIFELYPLSFREFLRFHDIPDTTINQFRLIPYNRVVFTTYKHLYESYIQFGGFPQVVLSSSENQKKRFLSDILNSYIELDVKLLSDFSVIDDLYKLISLLASRIGQRLDISKLSSIMGLGRAKLKSYIDLLERTYFLHLVRPFTGSIDRAIAKQPKVYLADTGLINQLAKIHGGSLFENAAALQLMPLGALQYFQLKSGQEIDFIMNESSAYEVKETPTSKDLKTLQKRSALLNIEDIHLIGRTPPANNFENFIWGGSIF